MFARCLKFKAFVTSTAIFNMTKNKIVLIGPGLKMGGMERASCNFANSLQELGHEVVYVSLFNQEIFFKLNDGIQFIAPQGFNKRSLDFIKTVQYIRKSVNQNKPDSVFALSKFYSAITLFSLAFTKIPVFISERSSPFFKWNKKIDAFNHFVFRYFPPKGVVAQTSLAAFHQKKYHKATVQFTVIPNPVREIRVVEIEKQNYVLAMGRFNDPNKGFDRLVAAFADVKALNWKLVFAGGDQDGVALKTQASELGILDRIKFLGKVDVDSILAESKIFVIPSRSEGFPNALCEAMAAGLPCVAFDFDAGPRDIITPNIDGILVENNNIAALSSAIQKLIDDAPLRDTLGVNALKIRSTLDKNKIGRELATFLLSQKR